MLTIPAGFIYQMDGKDSGIITGDKDWVLDAMKSIILDNFSTDELTEWINAQSI